MSFKLSINKHATIGSATHIQTFVTSVCIYISIKLFKRFFIFSCLFDLPCFKLSCVSEKQIEADIKTKKQREEEWEKLQKKNKKRQRNIK